MGGARVTTLVTLRKCTLGHKREIKTLKFVSASTKGFKGGLSLDQALQERHGSDFFLLRPVSKAPPYIYLEIGDQTQHQQKYGSGGWWRTKLAPTRGKTLQLPPAKSGPQKRGCGVRT